MEGNALLGIPLIFSGSVALILVAAALSDIRDRTIPNVLPALLVILFFVAVLFIPSLRDEMGWRVIAAMITFAIGLAVFSAGLIGGGDVKLFAALVLWYPLVEIGALITATGVAGLFVALLFAWLEFTAQRKAEGVVGRETVRADIRAALQTKVPYGVAILAGHVLMMSIA